MPTLASLKRRNPFTIQSRVSPKVEKRFSTVHRERPDGSDNLSFPSGHNTLAWTTAAVIHEFYGWKWGAVGYATGVITMVGRMGANKHWLSDTVGGAAAGIIIGGAIARAHKKRLNAQEEKWKMSVHPQFQKGAPGLMLSVSF
ncbi:MAG: phosphatase PAP2 family protein [Proteobacteria bacterium]|nr:MAG: phosphatase PAP2 family protein [Pseudomonadota bacterium]